MPLWSPAEDAVESSTMRRFRRLAVDHGATDDDADAVHRWSIDRAEEFWSLLWDDCGIIGDRGSRVIERNALMPSTRFFPDATFSVVENLLAGRSADAGAAAAIVAIDEGGRRTERSWDDLRTRTAAIAGALEAAGVRAGDRVAAWLPNAAEAIELMLGTASIGAVFTSASPDFGASAVIDRFGQVEPVVLVAADGYRYNGKGHDCLDRLEEVRRALPTVRTTVIVRHLDPAAATPLPTGTVSWETFVADGMAHPVAPRRFGFDHPWYVLYSSGTTGAPKCIVHRTGALLQHVKEHRLHCDVRPGDSVMYFTTTGWMMWNWQASALASGATVVCFDGAPASPDPHVLFRLAAEESVTLLGISAKFIDVLRAAGERPVDHHPLPRLRTICSTGSPLSSDGFEFVYDAIAPHVHLASISGGTDILGCFVLGDPTAPVYAGEIQGPALGMAVEVWDEHGRSLRSNPGVAGELVCTAPFPSMPLGFWDDGRPGLPDPTAPGPKYLGAYYDANPGVWTHGDFASWTIHGGIVIHGRSDATLNPGGVRIGTAEIYRVVEQDTRVAESLVFAQTWGDDVRIVLLVCLTDDADRSDEETIRLADDLRRRLRTECSPRHVPALVLAVDDLPHTRNGKLAEVPLADAVNGRPVRNRDSLANPEAIDTIADLPALQH